MKKIIIAVVFMLLLTGCSTGSNEVVPNSEITSKQWKTIVESADNTILNVLYYSGDKEIVDWLKNDFRKDIKIKYNIEMRFTYMKFSEISELLSELKENDEESEYDLIYLSDNGFKELKENDFLYSDVLIKLPNYYTNLKNKEYISEYDQGIKIDNYEVPIFKDQLVFINNEDVLYETPVSYEELLEIAKKNKGMITYPDPKTKTGMAFILSAILSKVNFEDLNQIDIDKNTIYEYVKPGIDYLIELDPYLYSNGESYPESNDDMDNLLNEGKLLFSMSMDYNRVTENIADSILPKGCNTFVINEGTTGNVDYFAVLNKSNNKSASLVVLNDIISGETQGVIYGNTKLNKLPIVDFKSMPSTELQFIKSVKVKYTSIKYDELIDYYIPEINSDVKNIIYELWSEYVK